MLPDGVEALTGFASAFFNVRLIAPATTAIALAVQPLEGWRELWVLRKADGGWVANVLPPKPELPPLEGETPTDTSALRAPIDRVFSALSKSEEFGVWFGVINSAREICKEAAVLRRERFRLLRLRDGPGEPARASRS